MFVHPKLRNTPKAKELRTVCEQWFKTESQEHLIHLLATKHAIELTPSDIPEIGEQASGSLFSSDTISKPRTESLFSAYSSAVDGILTSRKDRD